MYLKAVLYGSQRQLKAYSYNKNICRASRNYAKQHLIFAFRQNVESKGMRDQRLELQRRAVETSDDDLIPFGDRPTVSRFGAISRTSKTLYQGAGPMQAIAPQGAPTKPISISGKNPE